MVALKQTITWSVLIPMLNYDRIKYTLCTRLYMTSNFEFELKTCCCAHLRGDCHFFVYLVNE